MPSPLEILQKYWHYPSFRPLQEEIILSVLGGQDTLALLPTGGGKSVCFQVPALCKEGICLVISPLIALMKDQVHNLDRKGVPAAAIYSGMSHRQIDMIFENACNGQYKFLYVSPERLLTPMARERIKRMNVNLLAVDEAHCISQWGYDFRPPYLQISELRKIIPKVPVLALTATATSEVLIDIQDKLGFQAQHVFRQSFVRSNLSYSVLYEDNKREKLIDILRSVPGTGIVYARSRGETKEIAHYIAQKGINADFYHAGLPAEERSAKQVAWMEGKTRIIVSTNAFGMGIDKPDVRIVVHLHLPDTLEGYFQEAGRAGRDGKKSYATLLYAAGDGAALKYQLQAAFPQIELVRKVYRALGSYTQLAIGAGEGESFDFDLANFCQHFKFDQAPTHAAIRLLELEGWIFMSDAAASPARAHITANREELYNYQLRNKQADVVLKTLLRAFPGLQSDYVDISEALVAKYANLPVELVQQVLLSAQNEGVLRYEPRKEKPQITFTRERVAAENLTIDLQKFSMRKKRAEQRVERAIQFAETRECRSRQLLTYFDEPESKACGICDVCTGRHKTELNVSNFESYEKKIRDVLRLEPLPLGEILKAFSPKRQDTVAHVLNYLLDEGKLVSGTDGKIGLIADS
ncbi:MAG: ATP-dependent DNA helicase RecQ [Saprospiraceae bacterium]